MSDKIPPFDEFDVSELSEEDLSILQAFEAMDTWQPQEEAQCQTNNQNTAPAVSQAPSRREDQETLLVFAAEAEEDISSIRQVLNQLVQHEPENLALFVALKRAGHKLYGTAGAVGFPLISMIAAQVELFAEGVSRGMIGARVGVEAISAATTVLEVCLQVITSVGHEPEATLLLASLEAVYQSLSIEIQQDYLDGITHLHKDTLCSVPHAHPHVCCLLVQAGDQHLLIPFQQIQRVCNGQQEQIDVRYSLRELLAFPGASPESTDRHFPLLLLSLKDGIAGEKTAGIVVDEVLGEQVCIVEPLAPYLRRSGIAGATIDGQGRVLLVVDLLALIRAAPRCAGIFVGTGQAQADRGKPSPYENLS